MNFTFLLGVKSGEGMRMGAMTDAIANNKKNALKMG
jgi:hypothetical protein